MEKLISQLRSEMVDGFVGVCGLVGMRGGGMLGLWDSKKCYQFLLRISIIWVYFFKAVIFCFKDRLTDLTVHPR